MGKSKVARLYGLWCMETIWYFFTH